MRLDIDARLRRLQRRTSALSVSATLGAILLAILVVQVARLGWAMVTPIGRFGDWQAAPAISRDTAASALTSFDPFFRLNRQAASATSVVTSLQLTLFGTRMDDASGRGSAIIATSDGVQNSYSVGDEIVAGVRLKEVAFDHVTIDRGGAAEDLFIVQPSGSAGATPVATTESKAPAPLVTDTADGAGVSVSDLRAAIGFIPRIDGGRVTGLAVRPQGASGLFQKLGFRNGDVITQVNGHPVSGGDEVQNAAVGLAKGGNLSVSVERGAEILPLVISVKGQ